MAPPAGVTATGNRTDIAAPAPGPPAAGGQPNGQPVQVPTGLPYGENQALQQAQQAAPLAAGAPPPAAGPPGPPPGPQAGGGAPPPDPQQMILAGRAAARQYSQPNLGGPIGRQSERPDEHVMAGSVGGPPTTPGAPPPNTGGVGAMLAKMAAATNSPALGQLAARANALGQ